MAKSRAQYIKEHIEDGSEDVSFSLIDETTVARLQKSGDITLPQKKVSVPKDEAWNTKQMASKLLQGINNGDSIPAIAKSLTQVIGNNMASATRNARTMVTGAENAGRNDSYTNLAEQGVVQKKVWIATADDRTREEHLEMDGEEVDIDEEFSNGCQYPADPAGDPATVWNCRCSMQDHIVGFLREDGSISYIEGDRDETLHDEQIAAEMESRGVESNVQDSRIFEIDVDVLRDEFEKSLTKEEKIVVGKYQSQSFEFNQKLRDGSDYGKDQATKEEYKALDNAIAKGHIEKDATVYRGVSGDTDWAFDLNVGDSFTDKGYCSVSYDKELASQYGDEILFNISVSEGQEGAYISHIADSEGNTFEKNQETLLPRNANFEVIGIKEVEKVDEIWGTKYKVREIDLIYKGAKK